MIRKIAEIVAKSGADAWEITDIKTTGWEFYFIGHRLDQNRAKDIENITLKVYAHLLEEKNEEIMVFLEKSSFRFGSVQHSVKSGLCFLFAGEQEGEAGPAAEKAQPAVRVRNAPEGDGLDLNAFL